MPRIASLFIALALFGAVATPVYAQEKKDDNISKSFQGEGGSPNAYGCTSNGTENYCMLAPLPGIGNPETGEVDVKGGISKYLEGIIKLVMGLIGVLSVVMMVVGGIEYMTTVQIGEKEGAKARITSALGGLLLALLSYIILNTINPNLVDINVVVPHVSIQVEDEVATESGTEPTTPSPDTPVPSGDSKVLAQQILQNKNISLYTGIGNSKSNAKQNILDAAAGKASYLDNGKAVSLDPKMLAGMQYVGSKYPIQVNAIEGGGHSDGSKHYSGKAFDIQANPNEVARNRGILKACHDAGASYVLGPPGTGYNTNSSHRTHIHCQWP